MKELHDKKKYLRDFGLFKTLPQRFLWEIASHTEKNLFKKNYILYNKAERPTNGYFILKGEIQLIKSKIVDPLNQNRQNNDYFGLQKNGIVIKSYQQERQRKNVKYLGCLEYFGFEVDGQLLKYNQIGEQARCRTNSIILRIPLKVLLHIFNKQKNLKIQTQIIFSQNESIQERSQQEYSEQKENKQQKKQRNRSYNRKCSLILQKDKKIMNNRINEGISNKVSDLVISMRNNRPIMILGSSSFQRYHIYSCRKKSLGVEKNLKQEELSINKSVMFDKNNKKKINIKKNQIRLKIDDIGENNFANFINIQRKNNQQNRYCQKLNINNNNKKQVFFNQPGIMKIMTTPQNNNAVLHRKYSIKIKKNKIL